MTSPPLDSTHARTTSGVPCHHRLLEAHTIERRRAWHAIIAFGQHKRSNDIGHGIPSSPLDTMNGRTTSGVACHNHHWAAQMVERCRAWHAILSLGSTHCRKPSGVAFNHGPWIAHTVERRWAWHALTALKWQTRLNDVGCGIQSSPLD